MPAFKLKRCSHCGKEVQLWKSNPALCRDCSARLKARDKVPKPRKRIAPVAAKRARELSKYSRLKAVYMRQYPICQIKCQCKGSMATEIHHQKGKENGRLNDTTLWLSTCRACHDYITVNSAWAIENGYSLSRTTSH